MLMQEVRKVKFRGNSVIKEQIRIREESLKHLTGEYALTLRLEIAELRKLCR